MTTTNLLVLRATPHLLELDLNVIITKGAHGTVTVLPGILQ